MPGEVVQIGPFTGGLNTYSDNTSVLDNELVVAENFELDLDGSLVARPPIADNNITFPLGATGNITLLGYYYDPSGVPYLIGSDGLSSTYYFTGTSWTLLTNTIAASAIAQYNDLAYLMAPLTSTNPGGSWSPSTGFIAVSAMPKGSVLIAHKNRLWAASGSDAGAGQNGTRLFISDVAAPTSWPGNFISIGPGDGQNIVQVMIYYNDLLVLKTNSIYRFAYSTDPSTGTPSKLSPDIGLSDRDGAVLTEGIVYFVYTDKVYQISNYQITQINQKVPLVAGTTNNIYKSQALSVFNKRLIVSYWDTMYVFSLRTQRWTTWKSSVYGPIGKVVQLKSNTLQAQAVAHSSRPVAAGGTRVARTLTITDGVASSATEQMTCTLQTKNYNYESAGTFKRLFYWGIDAIFRGQVSAYANSVRLSSAATWDQQLGKTWGQMLAFNWGSIGVADSSSIASVVNTGNTSSMRKFVKLGRSFRFRQVYFRIVFNTDGSSATAPVRLFSIMTRVNVKEAVVKQVS